jgi:phosphoesterase RecJ-like protein
MSSYTEGLRQVVRFMKEHDRFLVISHVNPDGDTTGSALAMAAMLEQLGKSYTIVNEGMTPLRFSFLPRFDRIVNLSEQPLQERFSFVIAVDAADEQRMGQVQSLFADDVQLVNIDHHPTNDRFGTYNVIRTNAAATAEIMYDLAVEGGFDLTEELATCLYTGLLTDTGGFRYSNTSPAVMQMAARLLSCGVKPGEIAERALESITEEHVQLLSRALQSLTLTHGKKVAWLKITQEDFRESAATSEDASGIVNYGRNIEGVEVGILLTEVEPGIVKASLRSRSVVDVSLIAKELGGGGHARASGFTFHGAIRDAEEQLFRRLTEALGVDQGD